MYETTVRGQKKFRAALDLGRNQAGKRVRAIGTGDSPAQAIQRCYASADRKTRTPRQAMNTADRSGPRSYTVEQYVYYWHDRLGSKQSEQVKHDYLRMMERHIIPHIGNIKVRDLRKGDLEELFSKTLPSKRKKNGSPLLGKAALRGVYSTLKSMLDRAVEEDEILPHSPLLKRFKPPRPDRPADLKHMWDRATMFQELLAYTASKADTDPFTYVWLRLGLLGLRQGERNALTWSDIIRVNGDTWIISIDKQLAHESGRGNYIKEELKTSRSVRTIPIDKNLLMGLEMWKKRQSILSSNDNWKPWDKQNGIFHNLVLTTETGAPLTQKTDNKLWKRFLKDARLQVSARYVPLVEGTRQHLLRHAAGTLLFRAGVSLELAQHVLGHSTNTMAEWYRAFSVLQLKDPIEKLNIELGAGLDLDAYRKAMGNWSEPGSMLDAEASWQVSQELADHMGVRATGYEELLWDTDWTPDDDDPM